ncbi:low choriolytic enzyme isoform X3 [Archocentrus centrarchus]|uniref:low choriolytic enzyme isoform X3 n=1 Tax=Archocentrus centrarchus TaxID=63155 RepID=UPI0011EA0418|nr:low choriolytic enzyme-like isoform X3 [Archocentrus centrarchus]
MERIILLCMVSICLSAVQAQKLLFHHKWGPLGYKERKERIDETAMDKIIKTNERQSDLDATLIKKGMENIEAGTCVRFVPRTHQRDYIDIQPKSGCWSYLGARGGRQTVSLQIPECIQVGVVSHEFMHTLGFVHEQSRFDRDNYVTIMWPNISRDRLRNFEKFKTDNLDLPYDYGSIMHFGKYAYSQRGEPTIIPKKNSNIQLGQTSLISHIDRLKINTLYKCDDMDD